MAESVAELGHSVSFGQHPVSDAVTKRVGFEFVWLRATPVCRVGLNVYLFSESPNHVSGRLGSHLVALARREQVLCVLLLVPVAVEIVAQSPNHADIAFIEFQRYSWWAVSIWVLFLCPTG